MSHITEKTVGMPNNLFYLQYVFQMIQPKAVVPNRRPVSA